MPERDETGRFVKGHSGNSKGRPRIYATDDMSISDIKRNYKLRKKYGISSAEYDEIFEKQNGVCAICGMPETKKQRRGVNLPETPDSLHVDHDHVTGQVRGLLCYRCNTGIGKLWDDPNLLRKAADYLEAQSKYTAVDG
jgi:hypothetical protein